MGSGGYPCCCNNCLIASDGMTRPDSTDVSAGSSTSWTEVVGDWVIFNNAMQVGTANAIVLCDTQGAGGKFYISVNVKLTANAARARILFDYQDSSNFGYAEFQSNTFTGTLRIGQVVAGVDTVLSTGSIAAADPNVYYAWTVCSNRKLVSVTWDGLEAIDHALTTTLNEFGLGTGSTLNGGTANFKDFSVREVDNTCGPCGVCSHCADGLVPNELEVTIVGTGSRAALSGTYILDFMGAGNIIPFIDTGACVWSYELPTAICNLKFLQIVQFNASSAVSFNELGDGGDSGDFIDGVVTTGSSPDCLTAFNVSGISMTGTATGCGTGTVTADVATP